MLNRPRDRFSTFAARCISCVPAMTRQVTAAGSAHSASKAAIRQTAPETQAAG
jgi:hypothetical protein